MSLYSSSELNKDLVNLRVHLIVSSLPSGPDQIIPETLGYTSFRPSSFCLSFSLPFFPNQ